MATYIPPTNRLAYANQMVNILNSAKQGITSSMRNISSGISRIGQGIQQGIEGGQAYQQAKDLRQVVVNFAMEADETARRLTGKGLEMAGITDVNGTIPQPPKSGDLSKYLEGINLAAGQLANQLVRLGVPEERLFELAGMAPPGSEAGKTLAGAGRAAETGRVMQEVTGPVGPLGPQRPITPETKSGQREVLSRIPERYATQPERFKETTTFQSLQADPKQFAPARPPASAYPDYEQMFQNQQRITIAAQKEHRAEVDDLTRLENNLKSAEQAVKASEGGGVLEQEQAQKTLQKTGSPDDIRRQIAQKKEDVKAAKQKYDREDATLRNMEEEGRSYISRQAGAARTEEATRIRGEEQKAVDAVLDAQIPGGGMSFRQLYEFGPTERGFVMLDSYAQEQGVDPSTITAVKQWVEANKRDRPAAPPSRTYSPGPQQSAASSFWR